jgi:hypothetical protein
MWDIPVDVIARDRAKYYAEERGEFDGNVEESLKQDTLPLFDSDEYEIRDWASNNMDWADVERFAAYVGKDEYLSDYQDGWINGEYEIVMSRW